MSKTKQNGPTNRFWLGLGGFNALAMSYPVSYYVGAGNPDTQLFAALLLVCIVFVLGIADTVSIVFAYLM